MPENETDYSTFTASQWADEIQARLLDVRSTLHQFEQSCASVLCSCCNPDGDLVMEVGTLLRERYDADPILGDFLLGSAADARAALIAVIGED